MSDNTSSYGYYILVASFVAIRQAHLTLTVFLTLNLFDETCQTTAFDDATIVMVTQKTIGVVTLRYGAMIFYAFLFLQQENVII